MKPYFLYLVLIASFTGFSCKRKYCWNCTYYSQVGGYSNSLVKTEEKVCDKTEDEIKDFEKAATGMKQMGGGNVLKTDMICTRK
jgi:hypothetical protein